MNNRSSGVQELKSGHYSSPRKHFKCFVQLFASDSVWFLQQLTYSNGDLPSIYQLEPEQEVAMAMGSSCAIFFFCKYIVAKHKWGKKKSHIFEETCSALGGHKRQKQFYWIVGGLAVPHQARAPELGLCRARLDWEGQLGCCSPQWSYRARKKSRRLGCDWRSMLIQGHQNHFCGCCLSFNEDKKEQLNLLWQFGTLALIFNEIRRCLCFV